MRNTFPILAFLAVLVVALFFLDLCSGAVSIPFKDVCSSLFKNEASKDSWNFIIREFRLPKAIAALLAGAALSVAGLLMQTLFRNPLAGPFVLGITSGSSLGVAILIMGSGLLATTATWITSGVSLALASCLGSALVLLAVSLISVRLRDTNAILIAGLMFGSFTSAVVGLLSWFGTAEQLQKFTFWSMGNLGNLDEKAIGILAVCVLGGLTLSAFCLKTLDALLLGENYARSLGINLKQSRFLIVMATSLLAGSVTAFAGPIAFIGLAVPHLARLLLKSGNHLPLFLTTILCGSAILLLCDVLSQLPGASSVLPINAITSLIGAPVVIWLLVRKRKNNYA